MKSLPDNETIDRWISGELPDSEAAAVESYFEENPDALDEFAGDFDQSLLRDIDADAPDAGVEDLVEMIKTNPGCASHSAPSPDAWREVLAPSDDPSLIGSLGEYEVTGLVATGGMGIVFRARDPELERSVALKSLSPELSSNSRARQRFLREARAAAKLEHENILPIHGVHDAEGIPYFAMRLARGGSLQDALDRGETFDAERLKAIGAGVASALAAAHAAGIIHRDIKPANILFDEGSDNIWVCDFGIAHNEANSAMGGSNLVAGTPHYMSPEQAAGEELDGRSDLYSLDAVLDRCANDPPEWLAKLIAQLLEKDRSHRPADAAAVVAAIDAQTPVRRHLPVAIALASLAALAVIVWFVLRPSGTPEPVFVEIEATGQRFDTLREAIMTAPSGSTLLLSGELICETEILAPRSHEFHLRPAGEATPRVVTTSPTRHALFLSGDGSMTGIHFERRVPSISGATAVLGVYGSEKFVVENCRFTTNPNVGVKAEGMGFALTSGSAVVRDCLFDMPGSTAIYITEPTDSDAPSSSTMQLDGCVIVARVAIFQRSRISGSAVDITAGHCVFLSDEFLVSRSPATNSQPLGVTVTDSLIDVSSNYTRLTDTLINWTGRDNHYVDDRFPEGQETGAIIGPMFDRSTVASPIELEMLKKALADSVDFDWNR